MSWEEMQVVPTKDGVNRSFAFEFEQSLESAGNGSWIVVSDGVQSVSVTVLPVGCTVKVQTTTDLINTVKNGTPTPVDWDAGEVSSVSTDVFWPITALRLVQIGAGSSKLKVRSQ